MVTIHSDDEYAVYEEITSDDTCKVTVTRSTAEVMLRLSTNDILELLPERLLRKIFAKLALKLTTQDCKFLNIRYREENEKELSSVAAMIFR